MSKIKSTGVLLSLVYNLIKYKRCLNDDISNNYGVCKTISDNIIKKTKTDFEVIGKENIPKEGPTLITSNHRSFFDIFSLIEAIDRPMSFASAQELLNYPLVTKYINSIECVLIDRNTTSLKIMREQLKRIEEIINKNGLVLFPEGECSYNDTEIKEFKKGGFMSTVKDEVSIVPTYINYEAMDKVMKWMTPKGKTTVIFGESFIPTKVLGSKVSTQEVTNYTRNKVLELKNSIKKVDF